MFARALRSHASKLGAAAATSAAVASAPFSSPPARSEQRVYASG